MHEHGPDELLGPVRGSAAWWQALAIPPDTLPAETAAPKKKRKSARPIRMELVERVRTEIAAGVYETQEKWEAALDCLLGQLDGDA
jgi:hypothetical protein